MKQMLGTAVGAMFIYVLVITTQAAGAGLEQIGGISVYGGAEREEGFPAGGRGTIGLLGVLPLTNAFGLEGTGHYVGGLGSRYGLGLGPIVSWEGGKAGTFINYQHRTLGDNNFVYIRPSLALYFDQANVNLWYSQPVSSPQEMGRGRTDFGISQIQGTLQYFIPREVPFLRKDNLELTFGVQVNTFAGAGRSELRSAGVGPVWGLAFMPMRNVVVNLFDATVDNRSRYRVQSGVEVYFSQAPTLKELRRTYLQPVVGALGLVGRD